MATLPRIRLGTRASALARWQASWVTTQLEKLGAEVVLVPISTRGDREQSPIGAGSSPGVFTKEIQRALLEGRIDLTVHSLKDLPTDEIPGLELVAVPRRASVHDAILCRNLDSLEALPAGARVGTGSLRRRAQLLHIRPDLEMADIRGNVDTRLRKLDEGRYDAIVLAEAGLCRLGLSDRITQVLPLEAVLPAVGQGALALEARTDDRAVCAAVRRLDDPVAHACVLAERAMLAALCGGCLAPIAAWGSVQDDALRLAGRVLSADGTKQLDAEARGAHDDPVALGRRVAEELEAQGAAHLVRCARDNS